MQSKEANLKKRKKASAKQAIMSVSPFPKRIKIIVSDKMGLSPWCCLVAALPYRIHIYVCLSLIRGTTKFKFITCELSSSLKLSVK